jgi:hypothetical protein
MMISRDNGCPMACFKLSTNSLTWVRLYVVGEFQVGQKHYQQRVGKGHWKKMIARFHPRRFRQGTCIISHEQFFLCNILLVFNLSRWTSQKKTLCFCWQHVFQSHLSVGQTVWLLIASKYAFARLGSGKNSTAVGGLGYGRARVPAAEGKAGWAGRKFVGQERWED